VLSGNREGNEVKKLLIWIIDCDLCVHFSKHRLSPSTLGLTGKDPNGRKNALQGHFDLKGRQTTKVKVQVKDQLIRVCEF